jgi:hypothetical protein
MSDVEMEACLLLSLFVLVSMSACTDPLLGPTPVSLTCRASSSMEEFDLKKRTFGAYGSDCRLELPVPLDNHSIPNSVNQGLLTIRK